MLFPTRFHIAVLAPRAPGPAGSPMLPLSNSLASNAHLQFISILLLPPFPLPLLPPSYSTPSVTSNVSRSPTLRHRRSRVLCGKRRRQNMPRNLSVSVCLLSLSPSPSSPYRFKAQRYVESHMRINVHERLDVSANVGCRSKPSAPRRIRKHDAHDIPWF